MDEIDHGGKQSSRFFLGEAAARLYRTCGKMKSSAAVSELKAALERIEEAHDVISRRFGTATRLPAACEWILDNRYLAQRDAKLVINALRSQRRLRSCDEGAVILLLSMRLFAADSELSEEGCLEFLTGFQSVTVLSRSELELFPYALRYALLIRLSSLCTELLKSSDPDRMTDDIAAVFSALRGLESFDMRSLCDKADITESILRRDPANIYAKTDEKSRDYYRKRLSYLAEKKGMAEHEYALELLNTARERGVHIGVPLFEDKRRQNPALYIAANLVFPLSLSILCGILSHSAVAAVLLILPLSELFKLMLDYLLLLINEPCFLPRLDLSGGIPSEGKSICVMPVLLSSPEAAQKCVRQLEEIALLNRDGSGNLSFGILADLPEAKTAVTDRDAAVISALKTETDALNARYGGGFFAFTRPRKKCGDGVFGGFERKRGALLSLAKLISGADSELRIISGDPARIIGSRYILTLDGDTVTAPDSLRELIAAALHPMNMCVIDKAEGRVVSGFGILHPRIGTELSSVYANDFSRIFAGAGGSEPYGGLSGEVYMDLFRSGGFFGKGLCDAEALLICSEQSIPNGEVLSHDAVEGAYLHGGYMSDVEFYDAFPSSPLSYYRRLHRWTRGDWQNAPFIFSRSSELSAIDRFKLFDSLRRSMVAPAVFSAMVLGLIFSARGLRLALLSALLSVAAAAVISLTEALSGKRRRTRYHSLVLHGVGLALLRCLLRLWLLPYEAWICLSAAAVSLWRMLVSGKRLLQWETSAQSEVKRHGILSYAKNMCFAVISGLLLVLLSDYVIAKAVGLLWCLSPLMLFALSLPFYAERKVSPTVKDRLLGYSRQIWAYFNELCTAEDNYLPPDNFQVQPPIGAAHRTSPTNIGLAICSAICAMELGIDGGKAPELISNMLRSLERMPKKYGHFYNWYDTRTLRPMHPKYLSTVDCGNLLACLIAVKQGLIKHRFFADAKRIEALISPMELSVFYDPKMRLMRIGIDAEADEPSPAHYDLFASEARLTSYLAVARGDVPAKHWQTLSRAMRRCRGYTGMASWTGTMFEYLMPELFLPLHRNSLMFETAKYCVFVQKRRKGKGGIWGISESGFFSLDPSLSYRYKAHGCSALALKRGQDSELVISPYSAFLALCVDPDAAVHDLVRMERSGLCGKYGFFEALDLTPSRCRTENGEIVRSFMAHHLGMSLVAITNHIADNAVVKLMLSEPSISAYRRLLCEKLPISPVTLDLPEVERKSEAHCGEIFLTRGDKVCFQYPQCCMLTNGVYNIMLTESGLSDSRFGDTAIYASPSVPVGEGHGVEMRLCTDDGCFSLLPEVGESSAETMWELGESTCRFCLETESFSSECTVAVSGSGGGELRFAEISAKEDLGNISFELSFEPVLARLKNSLDHPAYWRLGMTAESFCGCLMLRRLPRGESKGLWLCLACDREVAFSADRNGSLGAISKPFVRVFHRTKLKAGDSLSLRFCIYTSESKAEAYEGAQLLLAAGPLEYGCMVSAFAAALSLAPRQVSAAMDDVLYLRYFMRQSVFTAKEKLWQYGISGDRPIILCPDGMSREDVANAVLRSCFLISCGVEHDLVLLSDEGGDYYRPVYSAVRDTLCAHGLEPLLGDYIRILPTKAEDALSPCASVIVGEAKKERSYPEPIVGKKQERRSGADVEFEYSDDGTFECYVNPLPPRAWCNMLTNGRLGYLAADNGCGNMWLHNARELRISPWKNDPLGSYPSETLELVRNGRRMSLFADDEGKSKIIFGFGFARWERSFGDTGLRCTAFIPPKTDARVFIIELCGAIDGGIEWKMPLELGDKNAVSVSYVNSQFVAVSDRSPYPVTVRAGFSGEPLFLSSDLFSWQARDGDALKTGSYPIFGAVLSAAPVLCIVCGTCDEESVSALCKPEGAFAAFEETRAYWKSLVTVFKIEGCEKSLSHFLNGWGLYQAYACRLLGRCSIYQSGGAVGFRDQLQDAVNLILFDPHLARRQLLVCCAHQYLEGDVMHWWHAFPDGDRGVRTHCSDDLLWLVWGLCEYVEKTGDSSVCDVQEYYVNSSALSGTEHDRYEIPPRSELSESVLMHAKRAVDCVISRGTGMHGLLLFGSGDWNDGMDKVGGESVWLSWFFAHTVRRFADLLLALCKLDPEPYRAKAAQIGAAADSAWDGNWYLRGYWPDGSPLGSAKNAQCRIDSVSQSWAAFCADANNSRVERALDSALRELYDGPMKTVKLFTPPFFEPDRDPGYIASYGAGFRENGGQYTHAAIWLASACLKRGREADGYAILRDILPEGHELYRYEAEPFVIPADVYTAIGHMGEAGWTWYTGSAAWYLRVAAEELFGLRLYGGKLYITPHLPEGMPPCLIHFAGHEIRISRKEILLDGEKYTGKGIPY